jgi:primosomal protein N' (replication factor Y)
MQRPGSHEQAFARFRAGEVKILLGTQMIAKGLDFPNVTLVGVINADTALHFPDFRAAERTFQLVTQVAGRTGRGEKGGLVLVQTFSPEHFAIQAAARHDFATFAEQELPVRAEFHYPPAAVMIRLVVRGPSEMATEHFAEHVVKQVREVWAATAESAHSPETPAAAGGEFRILGPAPAPIAKLRGLFRFHALVQGRDRDRLRAVIRQATSELKPPEEIQWIVDVDPFDVL